MGAVATKINKILRHLGMYLIWRMRLITNKQAPNNNFAD
jgi:hypothetical protein